MGLKKTEDNRPAQWFLFSLVAAVVFMLLRRLYQTQAQTEPKHYGVWRKMLAQEFGPGSARHFMLKVKALADHERAKGWHFSHPALKEHFETNILPGFALYQTLREEGLSQQEAIDWTHELLLATFRPVKRQYQVAGRLPGFYGLLRWVLPWVMRRQYPDAGWETQWIEVSGERIAFDIHRCYYLDTLKKLGAPELTPAFCQLDDDLFEGFGPGVRFVRTQTLGRGGECCNFRYEALKR